jgi:hypothetical protein
MFDPPQRIMSNARRFRRFASLLFLTVFSYEVMASESNGSNYLVYGSNNSPVQRRSAYLQTERGGFVAKPGEGISYEMLFQTHALNHPLYALTSFQNPCDDGAPFVVKSVIAAKDPEFQVESPAFSCVKNDALYEVTVQLFRDEKRTNLLGTHKQAVLFSMPLEKANALLLEVR